MQTLTISFLPVGNESLSVHPRGDAECCLVVLADDTRYEQVDIAKRATQHGILLKSCGCELRLFRASNPVHDTQRYSV